MKQIISLLLAALMVVSMFAGCGIGKNTEETAAPTEETSNTESREATDPTGDTIDVTGPVDETKATMETTEPVTEAPTEETKTSIETEPDKGGEKETEAQTEHKHNYKESVVKPTCTAKGYTLHKCSVCGNSYKSDETKATGHKYSSKVVAPTKDAKGYTLYTCDKCGHNYKDNHTDKLPADETQPHTHNYTSKVTAPTCTESGWITYTCACGHSYTEDNSVPTGHDWTTWEQTKAPTTESQGEETRTCKTCGETDTRKTDKLPAETEPEKCTDHSYGDWTCDNSGSRRTCSNCGYVQNIDGSSSTLSQAVIDEINKYRKEAGLNELTWYSAGGTAAKIRAHELTVYFNHRRPDGSSGNMSSFGLYSNCLGDGFGSASRVVAAWMNSSGHKADCLDPNWTYAVAAYNGRTWIVMFGY